MVRRVTSASILLAVACAGSCFAQPIQPATPANPAAPAAQPTAPAAPVDKRAAKPKLYDEKADANEQIALAVKSAKKNNRRVLIQWGGNWCGWCLKLNDLCTSNREIRTKLLYEYDVVHIDAGVPDDKNVALAQSYGAELPAKGFPYLTILDGDGKAVANHDTGSLEMPQKDDKEFVMQHDPKLVLDLLTKYQAPAQDAVKVLEAGLAEAGKSGKLVFLHFGAPWCPWCHRLDDWMDRADVSPLLSKRFVDVKVDTDRDTGGKEILAKYAGSDKVGIPWFAFISSDGKVVVDSFVEKDKKKENVGFPAAPEEIAHFEAMLKKAGSLSDADIKSIIEMIRTDKGKKAAGH